MIYGILCYKRKSTGSLYRRVVRYAAGIHYNVVAEARPGMDWTFVGMLTVNADKIQELCLQFLDEPWPVEVPVV